MRVLEHIYLTNWFCNDAFSGLRPSQAVLTLDSNFVIMHSFHLWIWIVHVCNMQYLRSKFDVCTFDPKLFHTWIPSMLIWKWKNQNNKVYCYTIENVKYTRVIETTKCHITSIETNKFFEHNVVIETHENLFIKATTQYSCISFPRWAKLGLSKAEYKLHFIWASILLLAEQHAMKEVHNLWSAIKSCLFSHLNCWTCSVCLNHTASIIGTITIKALILVKYRVLIISTPYSRKTVNHFILEYKLYKSFSTAGILRKRVPLTFKWRT